MSLLRHVVEQISLPDRRVLELNGATVSITSRSGRVLVTETIDPGSTALQILDDLQCLIAHHLMTPWPVDAEGRPGYPAAETSEAGIDMSYRHPDGTAVLTLTRYPVGTAR